MVDVDPVPPFAKRPKIQGRQWRIFQAKNCCQALQIGDLVFYRPKSATEKGRRGRLVTPLSDGSSRHDNDTCNKKDNGNLTDHPSDHCWVKWVIPATTESSANRHSEEAPKKVSRKRLLPVLQVLQVITNNENTGNTDVVVTPDTLSYRLLAASQIEATDDVLEVGCSTGETSSIIWKYALSWIGFDTSEEMIKSVQNRWTLHQQRRPENCRGDSEGVCQRANCVKIDALLEPDVARERIRHYFTLEGPSVVFIDIGGNRSEPSVLRMLDWVFTKASFRTTTAQTRPRMVIVKSEALFDQMSDQCDGQGILRHGDDWFQCRLTANCEQAQDLDERIWPAHPLQAPRRISPVNLSTSICRYHNYHLAGCRKSSECPFDHVHCHWCLLAGHTALLCPRRSTPTDNTVEKLEK